MKRFIKEKVDYRLYLVADYSSVNSIEEYLWKVEEAIIGGVSIVQMRIKNSSTREMLSIGSQLKRLTEKYDIPLIINDRVDVAFALDAEGVHLGEEDLPPNYAREILGPNKIIGYSCDNPEIVKSIQGEGIVDYFGTGDVFGTKTKPDAGEIIGIEGLKKVTSVSTIPVVAIGGITLENVNLLKDTGIKGIAVVSSIMKSDNPREVAQKFRKILDKIID